MSEYARFFWPFIDHLWFLSEPHNIHRKKANLVVTFSRASINILIETKILVGRHAILLSRSLFYLLEMGRNYHTAKCFYPKLDMKITSTCVCICREIWSNHPSHVFNGSKNQHFRLYFDKWKSTKFKVLYIKRNSFLA